MATANIGDYFGTYYAATSFDADNPAVAGDSIIYGPAGIARLRASNTSDAGPAFMYHSFSSIPAGAEITSAKLKFRVRHNTAGTHTAHLYSCKTTTGIYTLSKSTMDTAENPATLGQPTYRRAKDYNGAGGDTFWGGGGNWSIANDGNASGGSVTTSSWTADTDLEITCTQMIKDFVSGAVTNKGVFMYPSSSGSELYIYSYVSANVVNPYYVVEYTLPSNIFFGMDF